MRKWDDEGCVVFIKLFKTIYDINNLLQAENQERPLSRSKSCESMYVKHWLKNMSKSSTLIFLNVVYIYYNYIIELGTCCPI